MERKLDKGYHIKGFPEEARRLAKAGAILEGVSVGQWIADAVHDRWHRRNPKRRTVSRQQRNVPDQSQEKGNS
ncbi:MAG: hypothetical protein Q7R39_00955 [Dehalococcoidia bacterium]|nr:hypothetical protein [Dehalococcoidia bacterium]